MEEWDVWDAWDGEGLIGGLVNWLIGGLVNWLIGGLVDWLIGGLVNWLISLFGLFAYCQLPPANPPRRDRLPTLFFDWLIG